MKKMFGVSLITAMVLAACGGGGSDGDAQAASASSASSSSSSASSGSSESSASSSSSVVTMLLGVAASGAPLAGAQIKVCDAAGASLQATAAADGSYSLDVSGLTAPLLIAAKTADFLEINGVPQPANGTIAYAAVLDSLAVGADNRANVNQLTDRIASSVASSDLGLKGSVQLINLCNTTGVKAETIASNTTSLRALFRDALLAKGVAADSFDPVKTPMVADGSGVDAVLDMVIHNRDGWGSGTDDQLRGTKLYDRNVQEISDKNVALDPAQKAWADYGRRVFIIGDSTASNYPANVMPRMGWGQVFERMLVDGADVKVVNLAQSGRSSRSFITEGWFKLLVDNVKSGDYVLIQWGHNDEKCDTTGSLDWVNRCAYPNAADGKVQVAKTTDKLPAGVTAEDLSFQRSLEKYVTAVKAKGAIPVLITPVTRINRDSAVTAYVEGKFPIAKSTHITSKGDFPGDYSQTIIDTASANSVAMVDLDAASISFFNGITVGNGGLGGAEATGGWRDYYLAAKDVTLYPYYSSASVTGHYLNADRTHFQENGAVKVAEMVVAGIKADSARLAGLISLLK